MSRVEIQVRILRELVELGVEHSDDLRALVVDNGLELFVPQNLQHKHKEIDPIV